MAATPTSSVRRVLVVYKTSPLDLYADRGLLDDLSTRGPDGAHILQRFQRGHDEHQRAVERVTAALRESGLEVLVRHRPTRRDTAAVDLVIAVGGDGTFLRSAGRVDRTPMLGVNSDPIGSVGTYCGATADTFGATLAAVLSGTLRPAPLTRMRIRIGDRVLPHRALNDVLLCHRIPASSSRYLLRVGEQAEWQTSSGLWISTASGATGGIHSAGGGAMAPDDPRLQYLVREPCAGRGSPPRLIHGFTGDAVEVVSRGPHIAAYLDGHSSASQVGLGVTLRAEPLPASLYVYGFGEPL